MSDNESIEFDYSRIFSMKELESILIGAIDKTLGEIDKDKGLIRKAAHKKDKGIVGNVIEQSLLGCKRDNKQQADLNVDGTAVELKTTAIRLSKTEGEKYAAKEPVSVTAVSPDRIVKEVFEKSEFWAKASHLLFVYYLYSHKIDEAGDCIDFVMKGYQFKRFEAEDRARLQRDWTAVRDFIKRIQRSHPDYPEAYYHLLSSGVRSELGVLDTAPKWPNNPRFRFKRAFVNTFVQEWYAKARGLKEPYEKLPNDYLNYRQIDEKCHALASKYKGEKVGSLFEQLKISKKAGPAKQDSERIIVKMFGGAASKMSKIEVFSKFGLIGKTLVLTRGGLKTEDLKLFSVDFDEIQNPSAAFENSAFAANFAETQILFAVFSEPSREAAFSENVFLGFKRYHFDDAFIEKNVRPVWEKMRKLIFAKQLRNVPVLNRDGTQRINKNGCASEAPNWPKAKDGEVFIRGTGQDSSPANKPICINGVHMYRQDLWIRGAYIAKDLESVPYL